MVSILHIAHRKPRMSQATTRPATLALPPGASRLCASRSTVSFCSCARRAGSVATMKQESSMSRRIERSPKFEDPIKVTTGPMSCTEKVLDSRGMHKLDADEDRQPTKTESRGQYRRREDQNLCIEIQPELCDRLEKSSPPAVSITLPRVNPSCTKRAQSINQSKSTIGYYTRIGSVCGRTSVHVPKR